jgi:ribokinase
MKNDTADVADLASVGRAFSTISKSSASISILGSMNADYSVRTKRLPQAGETVIGGPIQVFSGGKSGNQAAAAALIGGHVKMFGYVGSDGNGDFLLEKLSEAGVDISGINRTSEPSGSTVITVDDDGENTIVYSPGSNSLLSATYVRSMRSQITASSVLGLCLESPINPVQEAAVLCHQMGMTVLLNDSPFTANLPSSLINACDILLVNEHELAQLLNISDVVNFNSDWGNIANRLVSFGFNRTIVTLGSHGSVVVDHGSIERIRALCVQTVDTTGCGDAYMGAVLAGLAAGLNLLDSAKIGTVVSAYAAMGNGAQASYGTCSQIEFKLLS